MSVRQDIRQRARELLADGEWHDFETVMRDLQKVVPPGPATRQTEKNRINGGSQSPERNEWHDTHRLVSIGKRDIVRESLRGPTKPLFEIVPKGRPGRGAKIPRRIRLAP